MQDVCGCRTLLILRPAAFLPMEDRLAKAVSPRNDTLKPSPMLDHLQSFAVLARWIRGRQASGYLVWLYFLHLPVTLRCPVPFTPQRDTEKGVS